MSKLVVDRAGLESLAASFEFFPEERAQLLVNLSKLAAGYCHLPVACVDLPGAAQAYLGIGEGLSSKKLSQCNFTACLSKSAMPFVVENAAMDSRFHSQMLVPVLPEVRSHLAVPLLARKSLVGSFCVSGFSAKAFTTSEIRYVSRLAKIAEQVLELAYSDVFGEHFLEDQGLSLNRPRPLG